MAHKDDKGKNDKIAIKPVDTEFATTKHAINRMRGLVWVDDPERGPENKKKK